MAATRVHHLNFVVRDLERASRQFEAILGVEPFITVDHAPRGANVAYSKLGETWLVLVSPYDDDSVPGQFLARRGEGFFLLSVGSDDLEADLERLASAGVAPLDTAPRDGILDWRVLDVAESFVAILQLTDDSGRD